MIATTTRPRIDETSELLNAYVKRWIAINGDRARMMSEADILRESIVEKYNTRNVTAVLEDAELNSIRAWRNSKIKPGSSNAKWIDTHVQGDLFYKHTVRIPAVVIVDGEPKPYTEIGPVEGREWWVGYEQARRQEADVATNQANEATWRADDALAQIAELDTVIAIAEASGIDPRGLRFEAQE